MRGFGDLEAAIMERVWAAGTPLLVREIQQTLEPERAYNTGSRGWAALQGDVTAAAEDGFGHAAGRAPGDAPGGNLLRP